MSQLSLIQPFKIKKYIYALFYDNKKSSDIYTNNDT